MSPKMANLRYKHIVSISFLGGHGLSMDPVGIVDGCGVFFPAEEDTETIGSSEETWYKCWLKWDISLLISSIHFGKEAAVTGDIFKLRCGGEFDDRPHDVIVNYLHGNIYLRDALPLPPRMGLYMAIPDGLSVTLVGKASTEVPAPRRAHIQT